MSFETFSGDLNPWYFAYQPVSYRLQGRMGSRDDLRRAIQTCRTAGVRVFADAVINHMTGGGNDVNPNHRNPGAGCAEWGAKNSSLNINALNTAPEEGPSPMYVIVVVVDCCFVCLSIYVAVMLSLSPSSSVVLGIE
jgi:hypothetical protein